MHNKIVINELAQPNWIVLCYFSCTKCPFVSVECMVEAFKWRYCAIAAIGSFENWMHESNKIKIKINKTKTIQNYHVINLDCLFLVFLIHRIVSPWVRTSNTTNNTVNCIGKLSYYKIPNGIRIQSESGHHRTCTLFRCRVNMDCAHKLSMAKPSE